MFRFIRKHNKKIYINTEDDKKMIIEDFCNYLLDEKDSKYKELFSLFVIKYEHKYRELLISIKEGAILLEGLSYCNQVELNKGWNENLTIYLDTEILFHAYGLNGKLYQDIFYDFYDLVNEINESLAFRKIDKRIQMKIFESSYNEIESFFYVAQLIKDGKETVNPSKEAMIRVVNECKDIASVIEMKDDFYQLLKELEIELDSKDYHSQVYIPRQ